MHDLLAGVLAQVAVERLGREAAHGQLAGQFAGAGAGAGEDQRAGDVFDFEDASQGRQLVAGMHQIAALLDGGDGALFGADRNDLRVEHVLVGQLADLSRHGGREEGRLASRRGLGQDRLDVLDETHAQHLVGFVQHHRAQFAQVQRALADQVQQAAGRADHDIHALGKTAFLAVVGLAAVDREDAQAHDVAEIMERARDLNRQLAGRRDDQTLDGALSRAS